VTSIVASARRPSRKYKDSAYCLADSRPHAAVVLGHELDEEVFELGRLRRVREGRVAHGGCPSHLVDPNHQRRKFWKVRCVRKFKTIEPSDDQGEAQERHFQYVFITIVEPYCST